MRRALAVAHVVTTIGLLYRVRLLVIQCRVLNEAAARHVEAQHGGAAGRVVGDLAGRIRVGGSTVTVEERLAFFRAAMAEAGYPDADVCWEEDGSGHSEGAVWIIPHFQVSEAALAAWWKAGQLIRRLDQDYPGQSCWWCYRQAAWVQAGDGWGLVVQLCRSGDCQAPPGSDREPPRELLVGARP